MKRTTEQVFAALRIEGGILPAEFLQRVSALNAPAQKEPDYDIRKGLNLKDEIGRYWRIASAIWQDYRDQRQREDRKPDVVGVRGWLVPLLTEVLGYSDLQPGTTVAIGDRRFPVSHRAAAGSVPFVLTTLKFDLDHAEARFGDDGRRRAPHALIQEYLNADTACLWGIVGNGMTLRLVRDSPSLTRPAYVEVDLERMFDEQLFSDFAAFWLIFHASRLVPRDGNAADCILETWRLEGQKTGDRALANLRIGVTTALRELGSGFVQHPSNTRLRDHLKTGEVTRQVYFQELLRLVYRLLFLFTAEERGLLLDPQATPAASELYQRGYSLGRLRDRARLRRNYNGYTDLWEGLQVTFHGLMRGAPPLGLPALGGLFADDQCMILDNELLANERLLAAIHALAFFPSGGTLSRVNYRDMGTEELRSVYESLLELHPLVSVETMPWTFSFAGDETEGATTKGSERKLSGSYYTPDSLVQELLRSALDPLIDRAIRENPSDPRTALLRLKVLDPACGSGHFLLGAARRLAAEVARLDSDGNLPDEAVRRHALREVVRRCIFGVDRNPLSVELCKTALWIEAIEPGKPLTFLDAHIKCGDSLIGVIYLSVLKTGIPDEAFKDLTGDDKAYARDLRKRNKGERENPTMSLLPDVALPRYLGAAIAALTEAPEDTLEEVAAKRRMLTDIQSGQAAYDLRVACDLWCAAFFMPRAARPEMRGRDIVPTTDTVWRYLGAPSSVYGPLIGMVDELSRQSLFFHWPLEFPEAFAEGGFDCLLGNPPWEKISLSDEEFFAGRSSRIASATTKHERRALIEALADENPTLAAIYRQEKRSHDASSAFLRSTFFPLTGVSRINLYSVFTERSLQCVRKGGAMGMIVPSGIFSDSNNKKLLSEFFEGEISLEVADFENRNGIFNQVHRSYRFSLLTIIRRNSSSGNIFRFYLGSVEQMRTSDPIIIDAEDIRRLNPLERTCPSFRSSVDATLAKRVYTQFPAIAETRVFGKPKTPFNSANDSGLFVRVARESILSPPRGLDTLYEAKMIFQFDHRYATFGDSVSGDIYGEFRDMERKSASPHKRAIGKFIAPVSNFEARISGRWLLVFRDITHAVNERSVIATVIPFYPCIDTLSIVDGLTAPDAALVCGNMNSIVYDYLMRQRIAGTHFSHFIWKQSPFVPYQHYGTLAAFVVQRVAELTYTAEDTRLWAEDLGCNGVPFAWEDDRRAYLRADLDAAYARLYGLTRDELRYILDPADIYGPDFPSETFRVLKEREIRQYGEYRTQRLVLAAWDRLKADGTFSSWAQTHTDHPANVIRISTSNSGF